MENDCEKRGGDNEKWGNEDWKVKMKRYVLNDIWVDKKQTDGGGVKRKKTTQQMSEQRMRNR